MPDLNHKPRSHPPPPQEQDDHSVIMEVLEVPKAVDDANEEELEGILGAFEIMRNTIQMDEQEKERIAQQEEIYQRSEASRI